MKLARFETILAAYGSEPSLWPAREAAGATALLATSTKALRLLQRAKELESVFARTPSFEAASDSVERVMATALGRIDRLEQAKSRAADHRVSWAWFKPAGFAFGALALFMVGIEFGSAQSASRNIENNAAKLIVEGPYWSFASL